VRWLALGLALGSLLAAGRAAMAQATQGSCTFTDESGKVQTLPNCGIPAGTPPPVSPAAPGAAKSFPFPGDDSAGSSNSGSSGLPAAPSNPATAPGSAQAPGKAQNAPGSSSQPAGQRFPFPGESGSDSGAAANPVPANPVPANRVPENPGGLQDAGSSGSSNSSSSSSSSSDSSNSDAGGEGPLAGDNDAAAAAAARRHRDRLPAAAPAETDAAREAEDIRVAGFYQNDGDYRGAYLRGKDAVSLAGDDAEAHLALAEAARKLGKLDEAESNYKKCLTLDPVPKVRKAAEKALKEMSGGG
jgi:hypothetical protein